MGSFEGLQLYADNDQWYEDLVQFDEDLHELRELSKTHIFGLKSEEQKELWFQIQAKIDNLRHFAMEARRYRFRHLAENYCRAEHMEQIPEDWTKTAS